MSPAQQKYFDALTVLEGCMFSVAIDSFTTADGWAMVPDYLMVDLEEKLKESTKAWRAWQDELKKEVA